MVQAGQHEREKYAARDCINGEGVRQHHINADQKSYSGLPDSGSTVGAIFAEYSSSVNVLFVAKDGFLLLWMELVDLQCCFSYGIAAARGELPEWELPCRPHPSCLSAVGRLPTSCWPRLELPTYGGTSPNYVPRCPVSGGTNSA